MTTTPTVRRAAVHATAAAFSLDARTDATDQIVTASGTGTITATLTTPPTPGMGLPDEFVGTWFRITNAGTRTVNVTVGASSLKTIAANAWAEVIWTAGSPGQWRVSAAGTL